MNQYNKISGEIRAENVRRINRWHNVTSTILGGTCMAGTLTLLPEMTYAVGFSLPVFGTELFKPMVKFVVDYYGTFIFLGGSAGAVVAQGDLRTKAFGFASGAILLGGVMYAAQKALGITDIAVVAT